MGKTVRVISAQPDVIVKHGGELNFKYRFDGTESVAMPIEHAKFIVDGNPNFTIIEGSEGEEEVKEENERKAYVKELTSIKGIGAKTAKDISVAYITKEDLVKAIKDEDEIPFDDDVVEKLKKKYGGDEK